MTSAPELTRSIRSRAIDADVLAQLRGRDDAGHAPRPRIVADGGAPLRCCLRRSQPGEQILLTSYAPLRRWARETGGDPGPYEETGPIFIHPEPCGGPDGDGFPQAFAAARHVFRCYNSVGEILGGRLVAPAGTVDSHEALLADIFTDPLVALVHVRAAEFGCFLFEVRRP